MLTVDSRLWNWFSAVDTDRSGAITAPELGTLSCIYICVFGRSVVTLSIRRARVDQWRLDS